MAIAWRVSSRSTRPTISLIVRKPSGAMISRSFLGQQEEEIDDVLRLAGELLAQLGVLRGDADRAGVQMALAHHDAADRHQRGGGDAPFLGAQHAWRWRCRVAVRNWPSVCTTIRPRRSFFTSTWCVSARPSSQGSAGVLDRRVRAGAGAAVVPADQHDVGLALGHAGGDGADADFGHQLDADPRVRGWRSSDRGSIAPDLRSNRCRDAAAARSGPRPACCGGCGRFP